MDVSTRSSGSSSSSRRSSRSNRSTRSNSSRRGRSLDISMRSSCSLQSWPEEQEGEDNSSVAEDSTDSHTILMSVEEEPVVAASVAQDYEDEIEEAREQGRREALSAVTRTNSSDIIVAVARDHDDEGQEEMVVDEKQRRKVLCWAFLLCCLLTTIGVTTTAILFVGKESTQLLPIMDEEDFDSNLKGVIVYTPPTQEECEAIANGTSLVDPMNLIQKSFDIQIDITLATEADFGALLGDLIKHIQQKLIPVMAGCQAIDFFDATIAIADSLTGASNIAGSIASGKVQESREESCAEGPIGNCKSFVLILDLYLEEDKSDAILLETIGKTITSENIVSTFGPIYQVQSASVAREIVSITVEATSAPEPPATPTQSPIKSPTVKPTEAPIRSPIVGLTWIPTASPTPDPTKAPTLSLTKSPIEKPTEAPTKTPVRDQTWSPSAPPTPGPTPSPTKGPTRSPTKAPTAKPTEAPTKTPVEGQTGTQTAEPTPGPTPPPTKAPTPPPTRSPTKAPTPPPTESPTKAPTPPPTESPTMASESPFCCSNNFLTCGGVAAECQASQEACGACNNAAWIQEGTCTTGLGWNDECTDDPTGCCAGSCIRVGTANGTTKLRCRI